jgi:FkbM family methyltransferase
MKVLHESGLFRVRACRYGPMAYLTTDEHVGRSLDQCGEWARSELELLGALLKPGDTVVDVGANVGTHAVYFAQRVGPTGAVVAFEPQRVVHQVLLTNATLNGVTWLSARHAAVGDAPGSLLVPDIDYGVAGNFGGLRLGQWAAGDAVPVFTLDSLGLRSCALLKVDVEGMEGAVFDGARALLATCRPMLYFEHNAAQGAPAVLERLARYEYACFWHFSPFFRADNFAGLTVDPFHGLLDANVLAVPRAMASVLRALEPVVSVDDTAAQALARRAARKG